MSNAEASTRQFVEAIGDLGSAWGLPRDACRVHALIYLRASGITPSDISEELGLSKERASTALAFLVDYKLAWIVEGEIYKAHGDPWDALVTGLAERRARDLPAMRAVLVKCRAEAAAAGQRGSAEQIGKMIGLVGDLSAIHSQAFRLPPKVLRGMINLSGRAARLIGGRTD